MNLKWKFCSLLLGGAILAAASPLELVYTGSFTSLDALNPVSQAAPSYFTSVTDFSINAYFDTSSPDLAPPSPPAPPSFAGFRAYAPYLATITIGGQLFTIDTITTNPLAGITVAIFDQNSFTPGRYAVGILQNPPADGAGIIGDFSGATPDFTAAAITSTVFTGYNGVGYGSGVCLQGTGGNCQVNAVTPLVLHDSAGNAYSLTLGNYDEDYAPAGGGGLLNTAALVASPEPGPFALALGGLALLCLSGKVRAIRHVR